jgi:CheY-like chemotaxis protein
MKILLAEDHEDTAMVYKAALGDKGHVVVHTTNGEDCLTVYHNEFQTATMHSNLNEHIQPFDAVILDYNMPRMNGLEVAKEILAVNPHQRIIFASAYLQDILIDSINQLNQIVEILNKPFSEQELIDTVEDKSIYSELKELNVNIDDLKNANFRHEQLRDVLDILKKQKEREDNSSVLAVY